jgi:hypothetical protein
LPGGLSPEKLTGVAPTILPTVSHNARNERLFTRCAKGCGDVTHNIATGLKGQGTRHRFPIQPKPLKEFPQSIRIIDRGAFGAFGAAGAEQRSAGAGNGAAAVADFDTQMP